MRGRDGFVLIAVIFITGLLAITTTAFVATVRSNTLFARALLYNKQLVAAADGMARLTAFQIATRELGAPVQTYFQCNWSAYTRISISVQDQGGLVDINTANPELLVKLVQSLGKTEAEATAIAAAIADYKDPDTITSTGATEASEYPAQATGPSDGPFATIEELDRIPIIDDALYKGLSLFVTVQSQQPGFDLTSAPKQMIANLASVGIGADQLTRFSSPSPARVFAVAVTAQRKAGGKFRRDTIISLTGQPDKPFALLKWSTSRVGKVSQNDGDVVGNCY